MMIRKTVLAGLVAASLPVAPASAATILVTYTGTVFGGSDQTDFFGLGTNLTSVTPDPAFTLRFTVDLTTPGATSGGTSEWRSLHGNGNANNPVVQTSFTLNGQTLSWGNSPADGYDNGQGYLDRYDEFGSADSFDRVYNLGLDYGANVDSFDQAYASISSNLNEILNTLDLGAPLDYQLQAGDASFGSFQTRRYDETTGGYDRFVAADLNPTRVTVEQIGAVPEPATWAFMIVGFGAIGYSLRTSRNRGQLRSVAA